MFNEKWSHKVTLPLGAKWGNNIGGVAGCLNWARPNNPTTSEPWTHGGQNYQAYDSGLYNGRVTPHHIYGSQMTGRNYGTGKMEDYQQKYLSTLDMPDVGYYPPNTGLYNSGFIGGTSRVPSASGLRSNEEDLLQKLKILTRQHESERKARVLDRNNRTKAKKLTFEKARADTPKGYGFMGPPPKRYTPTPPPRRSTRPANPGPPRPHTATGKTETYRYTEREITIEDVDDPGARSLRKDVKLTPHTSTYGTNWVNGTNIEALKRPTSAYSLKSPDQFYPPQHQVDNFDPTPLPFAWQPNEYGRSLSKADFLRSRSQTPAYKSTANRGYSSRGMNDKRNISNVTKDDENITINVDCAKLVNSVSRPKTVIVRLHGMESGEAGNIRVLTVPNAADAM